MREGSRYFEHIGGTFSLDKWTPTDSVLIICSRSSAFQRSVGLACRPAHGPSVDLAYQLAYQRTNTGLRQYDPYTSTSLVGTWGNTNFVPILYQPQISLGPINRTRLVWKFWKKYPVPILTWYAKKKSPLVYQDQAGMFDARPTMVESPKVQIPERNFVFLEFLWHPWKAGVLNMLLNFSFSSFVAGQGSLQPGKQREGPKQMIWWQGSTWVYLQIPLCSNKRPIYLFIAIYLLCSWSIQSGFKMSDSGKRQGFVSQL
jgi:hypothetical protein